MRQLKTKRGDTIIEVTFAIAVFALIAVMAVGTMNSGVATAEASLETTMARNEIDIQAESLRFVQNAYESSQSNNNYKALWDTITSNALAQPPARPANSCDSAYASNGIVYNSKAFVLDPRNLGNGTSAYLAAGVSPSGSKFGVTPTHPRLIYSGGGVLQKSEGLWSVAVKDSTNKFYDFYIYACWYAPGRNVPTLVDTVIRLYNPGA